MTPTTDVHAIFSDLGLPPPIDCLGGLEVCTPIDGSRVDTDRAHA